MSNIHFTRDLLKYRDEGAKILTVGGLAVTYAPQFPRDPNPWRDTDGHRHRARTCRAVTEDGESWAVARLLRIQEELTMKQERVQKQTRRPAPPAPQDHRSPSGKITWKN